MERANYPGDPGGYRKKHQGVRSRGKCRKICKKDPKCCHWVHYGRRRGKIQIDISRVSSEFIFSQERIAEMGGQNLFLEKRKI